MNNVQTDLCRVTVLAPSVRIDVALPADVPLAELVPTLLRQAGESPADPSGVPALWSLQRFGEPGLDLARTATALALRDGEILYLRTRTEALPPMVFDDVADAIATGSRSRPVWDDRDSRRAAFVVTGAALVVALMAPVVGVLPRIGLVGITGGSCAALLLAALILARALSDARAAVLSGCAAVAFGALAAAAAVAVEPPAGHRVVLTGGAGALAAAATALLVTVVATVAVGTDVPGFVGLAIAAALATVGGVLAVLADLSAPQAAAVTGTLALALTPVVPGLALRAARIPLPSVTADAARIHDVTSVPGADVLRRTADADRLVSAMIIALAGVLAGSCAVLGQERSGVAPVLVAALAAAAALRARAFRGRWQRAPLGAAAVVGVVVLAVSQVAGAPAARVYLMSAVLGVAVVLSFVGLTRRPEQKPSPVWRWAGDVLEALIVLSVVPLALGVLGVYGYVRGLTGG
jgi:type VII secretion integral membrane protein EccD